MKIVKVTIIPNEEGYMVEILRPQDRRWDHYIRTNDITEVFDYIKWFINKE